MNRRVSIDPCRIDANSRYGLKHEASSDKRCTGNRGFEIPQDPARSRLAQRHEPLTGGNQSGDRLIQVSQHHGIDRNAQGRSRGAKGDAVMQIGFKQRVFQHPVHQFGESASQFQACFARFPRQLARAQFLAQRPQIAALPRPANEDSLQGSGFFQIRAQESLHVSRRQASFIRQSFESEGVRRAADRESRVSQLQQAQKWGSRP